MDYIDASRESDPHALPDVEVFRHECDAEGNMGCEGLDGCAGPGWYYAYGLPGCMWDSEPCGPFDSEAEALKAAREDAGFCEHGVPDDEPCEDCDGKAVKP